MAASESPKPTPKNPKNDVSTRAKRSKSFTGCFTCRSRKIRCDLSRPFCNNCTKAGVVCSGYDIKLKWSLPLNFKTRSGQAFSSLVSFNLGDEDAETPEFFQRRNVDFVVWDEKLNCRPYETYEEMDHDLGILHNSGNDSLVHLEGKTKLLGPFGVFKGKIPRPARPEKAQSFGIKKPKLSSNGRTSSPGIQGQMKRFPSSQTPSNRALASENTPHDQLWLSNELRDDALLTAAALNGDTQLLQFMNNISPTNTNLNSNQGSPSSRPLNSASSTNLALFNTNQNDFLNLVFHRNHNLNLGRQTPGEPGTGTNTPGPIENNNMAMSNLLNNHETSTIMINPTNQHLYYSNYNNYYYNNPYQLNEDLEIHLHASKVPNSNEDDSTDIVEGEPANNSTTMPSSVMCIVQNPLQPKLGFDISFSNPQGPSFGLPSTALQVQPLTRYLLNYYITQVADLMTVIPLTENPWKTIYFPRALMAIGELLSLGHTSPAKNALLNALLAVSAFNLQSKFPKNSDAMKYYLNLGIRLRNQASVFVKQLLNSKSATQSGIEHCVSNEKYKDVLCSVMSMISVDLVWGTMQDTNFYIKWCGKVIVAKMVNKKKLSSKARILHRIFLSLKLIQDSTCLDLDSIKSDFAINDDGSYDVNGDKFGNVKKGKIDFIVNDSITAKGGAKNTSPSFVNKKLINTKKNDENFATDALYGLPNSLILLFSETVQLLRTKIHHQEVYQKLPDDFTQRVNILNKRLLNWKLDWKLYDDPLETETALTDIEVDQDLRETVNGFQIEDDDSSKQFFSPMHEITYHHILSFYHALMIYFNRLIKEVSPHKLQVKVAKTLRHLNEIQRLIRNDEAAIIPLFWQGFIAGCEATSLHLQTSFKKWGSDIAQYLGSYWGARQIMLEVWRRKRMNEARDDWVSVIQDWEMNLMLN
ncbi:component of the ARGR regulatory complex [Suhomyces tanzawaensis NRRL Y-17324]|uniref:Component of the ARGR regulatory complex n=1 Tax=Suhomyces tanzawaensis NRRL Y-17324 TaxID=984487 RepID=A0A1E4SBM8_9ASCO|nr:component of the ARGR regulatory complex [Suhomyces tanzawaensis NRRL Y-17324]ODV76866.1 component of the ARGR regulatory complex [Suhomyces tanzawaensis NRRL Y-17324]